MDAQLQAINSNENLITVVAGPGSGKTWTVIQRISRLFREGCSSRQIIAITYTNAAARELEERLAKEFGGQNIGLGYVGTLHGLMLRYVNAHPQKAGFSGPVTVIDEEQQARIVGEIVMEHRWRGSLEEVIEAIRNGPTAERNNSKLDLIRQDYFNQLRESCFVDFDSILFYGLRVIKAGVVQPFAHLFVDEFQDSSELDAEIYRKLPAANRFVVGDPDQSVYGFRGGCPEIMVRMLHAAEGFKVCLTSNYRSAKEICAAANNLISHNAGRFNKETRSEYHVKGTIEIHQFASPVQEMNRIAASIDLIQKKEDCAVICRANKQVNEIADFLEGMGIPVIRKVKRQFPTGWKQCSALLQVLNNPDNDVAMLHYIRLTIGERRANELKLKAMAAFETINSVSFKFASVNLEALPNILAQNRIETPSVIFITQTIKDNFSAPATASVNDLLCLLAQDETREQEQGLTEGVTVCTAHASKGREFESVYLPGWEDGTFPLTGRGADIQEERRVAFVALTRAKTRLVITHCERRKREWVKDDTMTPSRFLAEIKACAPNTIG